MELGPGEVLPGHFLPRPHRRILHVGSSPYDGGLVCCNVFPSTSSAGALEGRDKEAAKEGLLPVSGFRPSSRMGIWPDVKFFVKANPLAHS